MLARSVLFLPASNRRAIDKARTLACDVAILDLEDAVAPEAKAEARATAVQTVRDGGFGPRLAVRINGLDTPWAQDDLAAMADTGVDLIVAPKVETGADIHRLAGRLPRRAELWAMIETPLAVLNLNAVASVGGPLKGLALGVNDLSKGLGTGPSADREPIKPWMAATVAAARAWGLLAIDGVFNALDDSDGLTAEAAQGRRFGFDGKSLIHPSQIDAANTAFSVSEAEADRARAVVAAFETPDAEAKGAIRHDHGMIERLHLEAAQALLTRHAAEQAAR